MSAAEAQALLAEISDQQRQVLALGGLGYTSKEIARELGIAPVTVDQRFARARQKLGGKDRRDTIRIYASVLATAGYHLPIYGPSSVASASQPNAVPDLSRHPERMVADSDWNESSDEPRFFADFDAEPKQRSYFPLPTQGRSRNALNIKQRLFWIVLITILSMLALRTAIETMKDLGTL